MTETRHIEKISYPEGLEGKDKIFAIAQIERIPYEVSDEELDAELEARAREEAIAEITAKKKEEIKLKDK